MRAVCSIFVPTDRSSTCYEMRRRRALLWHRESVEIWLLENAVGYSEPPVAVAGVVEDIACDLHRSLGWGFPVARSGEEQ